MMNRLGMHPAVVMVIALAVQAAPFSVLRAEELLQEISWTQLSRDGKLLVGTELDSEGNLEVSNSGPTLLSRTVLVLESPGVTKLRYAIKGKLRYEGVEGQGYLELWSVFADGGRFFSRTLERRGPMARLTGDADWRELALPFFLKEGAEAPIRLVVNVVLPGKGKVWLGPLRLLQYASNEDPLAASGQWWSGTAAGLIGGIGGGLLGCLGGLIGWLGSTGRARGFVMGVTKLLMILGVVALALGALAVAVSQPYVVYYPLVLLGFLLLGVSVLGTIRLRKRYEQAALSKITPAEPNGT